MLGFIINDPLAEITTTLVVGYGSFVLAESTGLYTSGVLAMVGEMVAINNGARGIDCIAWVLTMHTHTQISDR